jgi:N6-adenosine-specific RNA methylase IME4
MKIADIKIGKRFRKDLGNLNTLVSSIQEVGLLHTVLLNENNQLIDGERRIEAYRELGHSEIPTRVINLQDIAKGEVHANTIKKDFTSREKVAIKKAMEPIEKEAAKIRQKKGKPSEDSSEGESRQKVAQFIDTSFDTLNKLEHIVEAAEANPDLFGDLPEKIDSGKVSVKYADKTITRFEDHKAENIPKIPEGQFDIILADPPWEYEINTRGSPDDHYGVMTNKQIQDLNVPSADNAILFLWATGPKLREALKVISEWGFEYKTSAVWIKDKIGTGYYFRGQHELLLVAEKGDMPVPQEKDRPSSVIQSPRLNHSEKPKVVYSIIETLYPNRSYLELFARKEREGWTSWGNELNK